MVALLVGGFLAASAMLLRASPSFAQACLSEFPMPATGASASGDLAAGPDGAIWFTQVVPNRIGRMTRDGVVTEFPVPTPNTGPLAIVAGPDGALWFTEPNVSQIGRITTGGVITEFPVPSVGNHPHAITAGPDGALWFVHGVGGKIGRITTDGVATEFAAFAATTITGGPDGALWFTGPPGVIGRMTTAGGFSSFPVVSPTDQPWDIAAGLDGALWFTYSTNSGIHWVKQMTTDGQLAGGFNVPAGVPQAALTVGPESALWFSMSAHRLGRYRFVDGSQRILSVGILNNGPTTAGSEGSLWIPRGSYIFRVALERIDRNFGAGRSDILWRHTSGTVAAWTTNGVNSAASRTFGSSGPGWTIADTGDFDATDTADLLWRHLDGSVAIWRILPTSVSTGIVGTASAGWEIAGTGDFNDDGAADILWRHSPSGDLSVWLMNGTSLLGVASLGTGGPDWAIAGVRDFDGDGKPDILWRHTDGTVSVWLVDDMVVTATGVSGPVPGDWQIAGVGDFNCDRRADILWRHTDGTVASWLMNGSAIVGGAVIGSLTSGQIAGVGDYNGDRRADILIRHANGDVETWLIDNTSIIGTGDLGNADASWVIQ